MANYPLPAIRVSTRYLAGPGLFQSQDVCYSHGSCSDACKVLGSGTDLAESSID